MGGQGVEAATDHGGAVVRDDDRRHAPHRVLRAGPDTSGDPPRETCAVQPAQERNELGGQAAVEQHDRQHPRHGARGAAGEDA